MKAIVSGVCVAAVLTAGVVTFGQEPARPAAQREARSVGEQVTLTGCVQREADYRQARDAGKGGVAGTGVGAGNEFVLTEASASTSTTAGARAGSEPSSPTGTTGSAAASMAYELSGPSEGQVAQYVGRRVEITGKLKAAETSAAGQPTGGATAGQPPRGVDVTSKDLKLRELEVTSVREATGTCPTVK
jgi:hypothetical protein